MPEDGALATEATPDGRAELRGSTIATRTIGACDVTGLAVAMVIRYGDDEPGSPWRWALHLDDIAADEQRAALAALWEGRLGGAPTRQFPWARKASHLVAVVPGRIELDHTPGRGWLRIGRTVTLRIAAPYDIDSVVTCMIPGHDRPGRELVASTVALDDERFRFSFEGTCGFEASFRYTSDRD